MKSLFSTLVLIIGGAISVSAQSDGDLKQYFEGRNVTLKLDMPATKDGVNVYPEREQPLNYSEYADRLKRHGISVRRGAMIMITAWSCPPWTTNNISQSRFENRGSVAPLRRALRCVCTDQQRHSHGDV
jgi:hypothetical protein